MKTGKVGKVFLSDKLMTMAFSLEGLDAGMRSLGPLAQLGAMCILAVLLVALVRES